MQPVNFEGAKEFKKPKSMTDEECMSIPAYENIDVNGHHFFLTAWKPSYEDLQALNRGEPIYVKTLSQGLPPMSLFTLNEHGQINDAL